MTLSEPARKLLSDARDLFATTHWTTGAYGKIELEGLDVQKGRYCAVGGLRALASGADPVGDPAAGFDYSHRPAWAVEDLPESDWVAPDAYREALINLLSSLSGFSRKMLGYEATEWLEEQVVAWNDGEDGEHIVERTLDEILAGFDAALGSA